MLPHHHLYGLAWVVAGLLWIFCGTYLLGHRARAAGSRGRALCLLAAATLAALVGARLHFLLLAPALLRDGTLAALLLPLHEGAGLRITGGLFAAGAVVLAFGPSATRRRLGRAEICDVLLPPAGLALAVGRLGCFADGCCFGLPCTLPWCVRFPAASPAYWSHLAQDLLPGGAGPWLAALAVHPLQLYLAGIGLVAFAASTLVAARAPRPGTAALVFVAVASALRALVEPLRESSFGAGVAHQLPLDLACVLAALVALRWRAQRRVVVAAGGS